MAVFALKRLLLVLLLLAVSFPGQACFGPKLYLGVTDDLKGEVLAELVALYIKEKTGVESIRVPLKGQDAAQEIQAERIDLGISDASSDVLPELINVPGIPFLLSGSRPLDDLQFTTVAPALKKLEALLDSVIFSELVSDVRAGEPVKARVRRLLMEKAWI